MKRCCVALVALALLTPLPSLGQTDVIRAVETALAQLGYDPGPQDGVADQTFHNAIAGWQVARGLPMTGGLSAEEYGLLIADAQAVVTPAGQGTTAQVTTLSGCAHEPAFGKITNSAGTRLGDFCVDRSTGSISGPISLSGLTLTKEDGVNFTYEDLTGGSRNQMQIAPVLVSTYHGGHVQDQSPEVNVLSGGDFFVGYIYNQLAGPFALAPSFQVHVGGEVSVEGGAPLGFKGQAQFVGGAARITLTDNTDYGTSKGTVGAIDMLVAENGTVTGSGSFQTQNIRTAGYAANEWVSMTATIDELRGFATGPTGQVIKSYALVTADVIDAEGDARQVKGSFEVFLIDPTIWE